MNGRRKLTDSTAQDVGYIEATICATEQELNACINFAALPGGFAAYAAQIELSDIWPIAILADLEVYQEFRNRGLGRAALRHFLSDARQRGAKIALLRVGWSGDDPDAQRAWRISWYAREGFHELKNTAPNLLIPFMYRSL